MELRKKPLVKILFCIVFIFFILGGIHAQPLEILKTGPLDEVRAVYSRVSTQLRQDPFLWTPLMVAAGKNPHPGVVDFLVSRGQEVNARSLDGWTPLMFAAAFNPEPEVVRTLIGAGANINDRTPNNWNFLYGASRYLNENITQSLALPNQDFSGGAIGGSILGNFSTPGNSPNTHGDIEDWELCDLLPRPDNGDRVDVGKWTRWIEEGDAGENVSRVSRTGWSALFFAARFNPNPGVFEVLVDLGDNPHQTDEGGKSPLDYALEFNPVLSRILMD